MLTQLESMAQQPELVFPNVPCPSRVSSVRHPLLGTEPLLPTCARGPGSAGRGNNPLVVLTWSWGSPGHARHRSSGRRRSWTVKTCSRGENAPVCSAQNGAAVASSALLDYRGHGKLENFPITKAHPEIMPLLAIL